MPFKPTESTFSDSSHEPILYYGEAINEPTSPATETAGASVTLYDTPLTDSESYRAVRPFGTAARLDLKIGAGAFTDILAAPLAVGGVVGTEQTLTMRAVGLASAGTGNPQVWISLVVTDSNEANWTGVAVFDEQLELTP